MAAPDPLGQQLFQARLKANDFVQEHLKTIVTIASGTLVLTVSFVKDVVGPGGAAGHAAWLLALCWAALGVAVFCGTFALAVLVNNLDDADFSADTSGVPLAFAAGKKRIVLRWEILSLSTFALGILALALFGALNYHLFLKRKPVEAEQAVAQQAYKTLFRRYTIVSTPEHRSGPYTRDSHTFLLDQTSGQVWQMMCVKGHLVGFKKIAVEALPPESPAHY